jgi:hypothetical protein
MDRTSKRTFIKRTEQEKLHLIDQWEKSELPIKTFCNQHDFSDSLFHTWLNKYRRNRKVVKDQNKFIPLQVTSMPLGNYPGSLYAEVITARGTQVKFYQPVSDNLLRKILS